MWLGGLIGEIVGNLSMSLSLTLGRNEKVKYYIKIKTHKIIVLRRVWPQGIIIQTSQGKPYSHLELDQVQLLGPLSSLHHITYSALLVVSSIIILKSIIHTNHYLSNSPHLLQHTKMSHKVDS